MRRIRFVHPTAVIGEPAEHRDPETEGAIYPAINPSATIEAFCTVDAGTVRPTYIGPNVWLMKGVHVGHDCMILEGCELAPHCTLGGNVILRKNVKVGLGACFKPFVTVGAGARIGCGAVVIHDVPAGETWAGNPARNLHPNRQGQCGLCLAICDLRPDGTLPVHVSANPRNPVDCAGAGYPPAMPDKIVTTGPTMVEITAAPEVAGGKVAAPVCTHGPEGSECPYCQWAREEGL